MDNTTLLVFLSVAFIISLYKSVVQKKLVNYIILILFTVISGLTFSLLETNIMDFMSERIRVIISCLIASLFAVSVIVVDILERRKKRNNKDF